MCTPHGSERLWMLCEFFFSISPRKYCKTHIFTDAQQHGRLLRAHENVLLEGLNNWMAGRKEMSESESPRDKYSQRDWDVLLHEGDDQEESHARRKSLYSHDDDCGIDKCKICGKNVPGVPDYTILSKVCWGNRFHHAFNIFHTNDHDAQLCCSGFTWRFVSVVTCVDAQGCVGCARTCEKYTEHYLNTTWITVLNYCAECYCSFQSQRVGSQSAFRLVRACLYTHVCVPMCSCVCCMWCVIRLVSCVVGCAEYVCFQYLLSIFLCMFLCSYVCVCFFACIF